MILKSHIISMVIYALLVCIVLALIRRENRRAQVKYAISLFLFMVVGALLFGWLMYIFIL